MEKASQRDGTGEDNDVSNEVMRESSPSIDSLGTNSDS